MRACVSKLCRIREIFIPYRLSYANIANNYGKIVKKLLCTSKPVAEVTMQDACDYFMQLRMLKQLVLLIKLSISCDGWWHRRGHSSLNGVVTLTVISMKNWKVLHVEPMSRVCKECTLNEELRIKDPEAYNI